MPSGCGKPSPPNNASVRLNRHLAACGVASRRGCDEIIAAGRVSIDGTPVTSLGVRVFPLRQRIEVDGREVRPQSCRVLMVHKPRNIVCTVKDPQGRRTILDLLPPEWRDLRLYPVGRLDQNSEGLILVTNDGDLALRLTHPRHHVEKEYIVWVREEITQEQGDHMLRGVHDQGERLRALAIHPLPTKGRYHAYSMILGEGRNRHIRRMCDALGVSVARIKRIRMGGLELHDLPVGSCRELAGRELATLRANLGL